ncbi:MAG: aldo/keto reductase [Oscillospiraceae bacterium]
MENIKKNFGFGFMRLPMQGEEVDIPETTKMVDAFLGAGFNYFDTAHGYLQGKSELALRECLTSRYPRDRYVLTDKLTANFFKTEADIRPFFQSQLDACGVEYFDFYLMHAQGLTNYDHFKACRAYETALELKREGKIRHFGISFHDRAEVLEQILGEYPEIEVVQIQFNYLDYEDPAVQSRKCYEVCVRHGKPVIVMEPVKGGKLVDLPEEARAVLDGMHGGSPASYAIRFAAGFQGNPDGALRHEQYGADAGQPLVHAGFPAAERGRACRSEAGAGDLPQQASHPLYGLPLLHRRLSEAHRHPRPLRHHELQAAPPPLERGFLL